MNYLLSPITSNNAQCIAHLPRLILGEDQVVAVDFLTHAVPKTKDLISNTWGTLIHGALDMSSTSSAIIVRLDVFAIVLPWVDNKVNIGQHGRASGPHVPIRSQQLSFLIAKPGPKIQSDSHMGKECGNISPEKTLDLFDILTFATGQSQSLKLTLGDETAAIGEAQS